MNNSVLTTKSTGSEPACTLFVYGSLMDPDVLQMVIDSPTPHAPLRTAKLKNYKMKMWSIYPTLVPHEASEVNGRVFVVQRFEDFRRLQMYETAAYTWVESPVELDDGTVIEDCRVFIWAGEPDSDELEDGSFDLERFQKHYKPQLLAN